MTVPKKATASLGVCTGFGDYLNWVQSLKSASYFPCVKNGDDGDDEQSIHVPKVSETTWVPNT